MNKTLKINGKEIKTKMFVTRKAAQNFMDKTGGELVFFGAHKYYVEVV